MSSIRIPPSELGKELVEGVLGLYDRQEYTDVVFRVETENGIRELGAHRFILAIRSPVFAERFHLDGAWSSKTTVVSEAVDYQVLSTVLDFFYTDKLSYEPKHNLLANLCFLAQVNIVALRYALPRLVSLTHKEMSDWIESAKSKGEELDWHQVVLRTLRFTKLAKTVYGSESDFGLEKFCLQTLSSPRPTVESDRSLLLFSLCTPVESLTGVPEAGGNEPAVCSVDTCIDILMARCGRNETVMENAILCGRVDVIKSLLDRGINGEGKHETGNIAPLELAFYLSSALSGGGIKESSTLGMVPDTKKDIDMMKKYGFALKWLNYSNMYSIAVALVSSARTNESKLPCNVEVDIVALEGKQEETLLGIACAYGNIKHVQILLKGGVRVNSLNSGRAPLHIATANRQAGVVTLLLEHGAVPNLQDSDGKTALHLACQVREGYPVVSALLNTDDYSFSKSATRRPIPNVNIPDRDGWTALHHVAASGSVECCRLLLTTATSTEDGLRDLLLATDYDKQNNALHIAASYGNPQILEEILLFVQKKNIIWPESMCDHLSSVDVYAKSGCTTSNQEDGKHVCSGVSPLVNFGNLAKETPLHRAAILVCDTLSDQIGNVSNFERACRCIEILLEHKANPLSQTIVGYVALHHLLGGMHANGPISDYGKIKRSPTSFSSLQKQNKLSLQSGESKPVQFYNIRDAETPFNEFKDDTLLLRPLTVLLNSKGGSSSIFVVAKDKVTPLHCAVRFRHAQTVALLVRRGADIHARDIFNNSPLSLARDLWPFPKLANHMLKLLPSAPTWVDDSDTDRCESCTNLFSVRVRRHHCRYCGSIICTDCSPHSIPLPRFGIERSVRVCTACYEALSWPSTEMEYETSGDQVERQDLVRDGIDSSPRATSARKRLTRRKNEGGVISPTRVRSTAKKATRHDVVME